MKYENRFYEVAAMLPPFENLLLSVPRNISAEATEIRVRAGKPLIVETISGRYVCGNRSAEMDEIYSCVKSFCNYSVHSCQREFSQGWITLKGGHRAGFTGTAHVLCERLETIKDISSLNVRISREHKGISDRLFAETVHNRNFSGLIIAGPPLSGKTTMLRDYCRNLGTFHKTSLIDERGEIAAVYNGVPQNDVGINTDILNCFPKAEGIDHALRVLSPEYIVCDEAGQDTEILSKCAGMGIKPIITVHCGDIHEAAHNQTVISLINSGAVNYIAFFGKGKNTGIMKGLWCVDNGEALNSCNDGNNLLCSRYSNVSGIENAYAPA